MIEKKEDLGNAIALNSSLFNAARLLGPSLAGILIATLGEGACFLLNAVIYIAVIISLLMLLIPPREREESGGNILRELKEGFVYVFSFLPIKYILALLALISLMGVPYQVLMPVFARDIFHGGPKTLGFLMAMSGAGALAGAIYLAGRRSVLGLGRLIAVSAGIFGLAVISFSLSRILWLSLFLILIVGFGVMVQMASSNTILQTVVDEDKRGRVMSFFTMAFMGTAPFGSLLAGSLAGKIGAANTLFIGGICCIIGALVFAGKLPVLRSQMRLVYAQKGIIPEIARGQDRVSVSRPGLEKFYSSGRI